MFKYDSFHFLKHALTHIPTSYHGVSTTIGLLAHSGLNHTQQMQEMCYLLQKLFNLSSCGFFWADESGSMQDAWCTTPSILSFKTLMSCREYQESGTRTWPTFQENVLKGAIAGYLLPFQNNRFYQSTHYQTTYQTINVRHILDVVLHDGLRPFGAFLLMRSAGQGSFTPDERKLFTNLIPIFNVAFTQPCLDEVQYSEKELTGFALLSSEGKYKSISDEARRIVWILTHARPGSFVDPNDPTIEIHLEKITEQYWDQLELEQSLSIKIENRWGRFHLYFEQECNTNEWIVTLARKIPLVSQLAFQLIRLSFPPMRLMVAWLLAQNYSRSQIASILGISVETVTSHIKLIYKATKTSSSHGLLLNLVS